MSVHVYRPLGEKLFKAVKDLLLDDNEEVLEVRVLVRDQHDKKGIYTVWKDGAWRFDWFDPTMPRDKGLRSGQE